MDETRGSLPDLAVLDVSPSRMSGLDVCRALRARPTMAGAAILIMSAWALNADVSAGLGAGADDYLVKPFDNAALLARCHAAIERHAVVRDPAPLQPPGEPAAV